MSLGEEYVCRAFVSAGILYLFGMILYPAGWGAERVQRICGPEADAFYLANCSLGMQINESLGLEIRH